MLGPISVSSVTPIYAEAYSLPENLNTFAGLERLLIISSKCT